MAKSSYQAWKEAKEKEKQRKAAGIIHFKEDSKSSRAQVPPSVYSGKSRDKSYKWETDLLKPLNVKQYGRSYNDKYDNWAKSQGMTPGQADDYRSQMDFEEDRKKENHYANGMKYESEIIDGIFKGMEAKQKQRFASNTKRSQEKKAEEAKKKKNPTPKKKDFWDNAVGFLKGENDIRGRSEDTSPKDFETSYNAVGKVLEGEKPGESDRFVAQYANTLGLGLPKEMAKLRGNKGADVYYNQREFGEGGGTDMVAQGLGYLTPGIGAYKLLNASKTGKSLTQLGLNGIPQRLGSEAVKGAMIGAGMSGTEVGIREGLNPDDYNWKQNLGYIGMNTAIGAVADPLLYGAGKGIAKGFEKSSASFMEGLLPKNEQVASTIANSIKADNALPIVNNRPNPMMLDDLIPRAGDIANPNYVPSIMPKAKTKVDAPTVGKPLDEILANPKPVPELDNAIPMRTATKSKPSKSVIPENVQAMQSESIPLREPSGTKQFKEMSFLPSIGNKVKKSFGAKGYEQPITRQELLNNTRKNLNVTLRHGRLGNVGDDVQGYFKVDSEVIRTKKYGDIQVISHEIGHHLDKQFKLTDASFDSELLKLGKNTSGVDYTPQQVREEGLAEFIRLYLSDPQKALANAPKFSQHFESVLPKKVKSGLLKTQADVDRWIEQGPELRLRGKIDRSGKEVVTAGEKVDKLYSQFIDKFDRMKKVEKAVTGKLNSAEQSLYKKARLSVGAPKKAEMILRDFKSILKPIDQYGYNMKDVSDYATAVHARELEALDIESGMTKEEIEKVIAKFDTPEMKQVHQGLLKYNNRLLSMLEQGQVISKDAVKAMKEKYPNYVPFYRFFEDDIAQGFGGKGFTNLTNPVKRLKGSTRDVIDPLESMIKNTFAVVNVVEKNKVGLELSRLADIEGAGRFIERLDGAQNVKKEHIVTVFENGEKHQYQLDKDLYESIQQLDEDVTNKVIQLLSKPTAVLRAGATLTPEFMVRNPIRDQFQAFVVSNYGYNPIIDLPIGLWKTLMGKGFNKEGVYKQWAESGGGYGNYLSQDRDYLRETLSSLKREGKLHQKGFKTITNPKELGKVILKTLQTMSEYTEEATKVGEFRRAMKKGASVEEAAFQSRDLMDFGRVGTDMQQWNRAVAFLNANIQGKDKIARSFKHNPVRTTTRAITGVTIPAIGAYLSMEFLANETQKETYENTPKWMKDTFFILPIPGTDELARIPKPFDLAPVFANPVEQIMDYIKGNDPDTWDEFLKRQALEISKIPHMLTGIAPVIENVTNYSFFTGGPIVPRRDQDLLPEDQYGVTTSLTARTIGKLTGTSPYKTDNLIRGYGAGLGKYATSGVDNLLEALKVGKLPPQEQKKWSELPVVNAFTVDSTGGGQIMTDFYDTIDKLTKERNSAKRNQSGYKEGDEVRYERVNDYKHLTKVSREISDLRNEYREIQNDYDMSPQSKRSELDELDREMNRLAREALIKIGEKKR